MPRFEGRPSPAPVQQPLYEGNTKSLFRHVQHFAAIRFCACLPRHCSLWSRAVWALNMTEKTFSITFVGDTQHVSRSRVGSVTTWASPHTYKPESWPGTIDRNTCVPSVSVSSAQHCPSGKKHHFCHERYNTRYPVERISVRCSCVATKRSCMSSPFAEFSVSYFSVYSCAYVYTCTAELTFWLIGCSFRCRNSERRTQGATVLERGSEKGKQGRLPGSGERDREFQKDREETSCCKGHNEFCIDADEKSSKWVENYVRFTSSECLACAQLQPVCCLQVWSGWQDHCRNPLKSCSQCRNWSKFPR